MPACAHPPTHPPCLTLLCLHPNGSQGQQLRMRTPTNKAPPCSACCDSCALLGDNLAALAEKNGWSGIIVHGCVRDTAQLAGMQVRGVSSWWVGAGLGACCLQGQKCSIHPFIHQSWLQQQQQQRQQHVSQPTNHLTTRSQRRWASRRLRPAPSSPPSVIPASRRYVLPWGDGLGWAVS